MSTFGAKVAAAMDGKPAKEEKGSSVGELSFTELAESLGIPKDKRERARLALKAFIAAHEDDED